MVTECLSGLQDKGSGKYSFSYVRQYWLGGKERCHVHVDIDSEGRRTYFMEGSWDHCSSLVEDEEIISLLDQEFKIRLAKQRGFRVVG